MSKPETPCLETCRCADREECRAELDNLKAQNAAQAQELERLRDLIKAISCDEATVQDCERYCAHGLGPLHAEARALRAAREGAK